MPDETQLIAAGGVAVAATLAVTPVAIAVAGRMNFHDRPVGYKGHLAPTPYLGGAAVIAGFLLAALTLGGELDRLGPIIGGAAALWLLGTVDDRRPLSPRFRLVVEAAVGAALWLSGLGWSVFGSDALDLVASIVWVVGLVNAFNLMDNMDGAAGTVGAVTAFTTAVLALIAGDPALAAVAAALGGACLGFLPYNLARPARIFLGDGGSLLIGFVIAASLMAMPDAEDVGLSFVLAAALLAGLPVLDTTLVLVSRRRAGIPLLTGGRDHLTHRLFTRLGSPRTVAVTLACTQAVLGAIAIGVTELGQGSVIAAWSVWFVAAAAAVAMLETEGWAPVREARPTPVARLRKPSPRRLPLGVVEAVAIAFIVISCGLSPFLYGFYDLSVWGPITLFMLAALLGLVIARPAAPRRTALLALGGLVALSVWSLASTRWAESAAQAMTDANRWLLYASLLGVLVLLLRNDRLSRIVVAAAAAAITAFALYLTGRMMIGDGASLFLGRRLNFPLGYVNGEAGYLLLGLWPLIALAERADRHWLAGAGVGGATLLAGLAVLAQTRAVVPAVVLSAIVIVAVVPGRGRRVWALVAVAAGVGAALGPLLEVYDSTPAGGTPDDGTIATAAAALSVAALGAGVLWGLATAGWSVARSRRELPRPVRHAIALAPIVAVVVAIAAVTVASNPVDRIDREYSNFVDLRGAGNSDSRFTSGAGNRYDYWRVAADQFTGDPLKGVGAGNYDRTYFLERRTTEDIRQAHSIEMQVLGELGVPGLAALGLFVIAVLFGFARRARAAKTSLEDRGLAVAAGGAFLVWLLHTSVDWLHLIPGVTGLALAFAAVLVGPWKRPTAEAPTAKRRVVVLACTGLIVVGAVLVGRSALAESYRSDARDALESSPTQAISKAGDSLALDDEALDTYYVEAAAYARLDDYRRARATLLEAARREPHDFVTWGLIGDLAVRRGELAQAKRAYQRAADLNPRNPGLQELAKDPASAEQ
jgi:UDP-GlcNAc:undecaprenyl-phosphate GlcNAc-1-phosphate transferase